MKKECINPEALAKKSMSKTEVKDIKENAKGLFAKQSIEKGNIIAYLKGKTFSKPTRTSVQIKDKHIEDLEGGYMNHHCDPSAEIRIHDDFIGRNPHNQNLPSLVALVVASRDIKKGDEITFDYETTESELSHPFNCDCHGKFIKGRGR